MNDELTPEERAALRARIVGGARDITPAGAHRGAWVAGSIAAVLVVGIAGGVAVTSTLSAPPVASTPSPTGAETTAPTPITEPTPTASPTSSASATPGRVPLTLALDGDCARVLSDAEVSEATGVPMTLSRFVTAYDAGVLGGVSCQWAASGDGYQTVGVDVFPQAVVPESVRSTLGVPSDCTVDGMSCRSVERFGDAVVEVRGTQDDIVSSLLAMVGERAAASPGRATTIPGGRWVVPDCERVREVADVARGRGDLVAHRGDALPWGLTWEVLSANGAAGFCALDNLSAVDTATVVDIALGPGSAPDLDEVQRSSGRSVGVPGADAAWFFSGYTSTSDVLLVQAGENVLTIATGNMTEQEMVEIAGAIVRDRG